MKKQKIQLIILALVAVVCVGAYFLLRQMDLPEDGEEETEMVTVTEFDADAVTALSSTGEYPLNFVKEDGTWYNSEDRTASIEQSSVDTLVSRICNITTDTFIENPEDLTEYGLDAPFMTITATLESGSSVILRLGDANGITGDYYAQVEGDDSVYLVDSLIVTAYQKTPEEFVEEETETVTETITETAETETSEMETDETAATEEIVLEETTETEGTEEVTEEETAAEETEQADTQAE